MRTYEITPFEFDETADLQKYDAWFLDGTHSVPPWTPMFGWSWINYCRHGMMWAAQKLQLPTCKGWDWRLHRGGGYLAVLVVDDPGEIAAREQVFRKQLEPFIEDYDAVWQKHLDELQGYYGTLKAFDIDSATNIELLDHMEDAFRLNRRMWEIHFYFMYVVFGVYMLFEAMMKQMFGIDDSSPEFHKVLTGFDNKVFQVDKKLWEFGKKAQAMGLDSLFMNNPPERVGDLLEQTEAGRLWLADFREFLSEDGWRSQRMSEFINPTWIENPAPAYMSVRQFLQKGGDFDLERERARLGAERQRAEKELLDGIPDEQRGWFTKLLRLAQRSGSFSEEHNHWLDLYTHALVRRALVGWGERLVAAGVMDRVEDVFFLIPDEIRRVALAPEWHDLRDVVADRRAEWAAWAEEENPPMIGRVTLEEAMGTLIRSNDPVVLKVVVGSLPVPKPELKADLYGTCGSPGVVEGRARMVMTDADLINVEEGDILVAPATYPSWTAVFALLGGVVVDRGASLSHAAIVGREYGIPVVMNVFEGTKVIKDGMRIRVDGNMGTVTILND
ncbi:MAG: PEP-utilizing enzyme [Thermoleophilia bacterium]|nr:PEP-utilizing enzyme [Thermoleophilia bacterium]